MCCSVLQCVAVCFKCVAGWVLDADVSQAQFQRGHRTLAQTHTHATTHTHSHTLSRSLSLSLAILSYTRGLVFVTSLTQPLLGHSFSLTPTHYLALALSLSHTLTLPLSCSLARSLSLSISLVVSHTKRTSFGNHPHRDRCLGTFLFSHTHMLSPSRSLTLSQTHSHTCRLSCEFFLSLPPSRSLSYKGGLVSVTSVTQLLLSHCLSHTHTPSLSFSQSLPRPIAHSLSHSPTHIRSLALSCCLSFTGGLV